MAFHVVKSKRSLLQIILPSTTKEDCKAGYSRKKEAPVTDLFFSPTAGCTTFVYACRQRTFVYACRQRTFVSEAERLILLARVDASNAADCIEW